MKITNGLIIFFLLLSLIVASSGIAYAQDAPVNKHYEKQQEKRKKDAKKAEKELLKQHEKIQTKETRKAMKANKKKAKRLKKGKHQEPFYKKWFIKSS